MSRQINLIEAFPKTLKLKGIGITRSIFLNGSEKPLEIEESLKVHNHGGETFNWGYHGSEPAQLALALLLKYIPAEDAKQYYQQFKSAFVARLPPMTFSATLQMRKLMGALITGETLAPADYMEAVDETPKDETITIG